MLYGRQLLEALVRHLFFSVAYGSVGGPGVASLCDLLLFFLSTFLRQSFSAALDSVMLPSVAAGLPSDFAMSELHVGLRPDCVSSVIGRGFAAPGKVGADPPPLTCASTHVKFRQ